MRGSSWRKLIAPITAAAAIAGAHFPESAWADHRVAGFDELVVYAPGTHERGLPGVELTPGLDGTDVQITPIVHVHRFYYDGDKEFQGPLLQGGPTIVVANHPKTAKKMYIEVNLPAGAPVIAYTAHCITYAYKDRRVAIEFCPLNDNTAEIKMLPGRGVVRNVRDTARQKKADRKSGKIPKDPVTEAVCEVGRATKKVAVGTVGMTAQVVGSTLDGGRKVIEALPPFTQLKSAGEQHEQRKGAARQDSEDRRTIR